jgi:hypothetical protein
MRRKFLLRSADGTGSFSSLFYCSTCPCSAIHQVYPPIVAASTRSSTLHYCGNDRDFAWGPIAAHDHQNRGEFVPRQGNGLLPQVLFIDAGYEWNCYASLCHRTLEWEFQCLGFSSRRPHRARARGIQKMRSWHQARAHRAGMGGTLARDGRA